MISFKEGTIPEKFNKKDWEFVGKGVKKKTFADYRERKFSENPELHYEYNKLTKNSFIRDVTQVGSIPKSEVRRRMNEIIRAEIAAALNKVELDGDNHVCISNDGECKCRCFYEAISDLKKIKAAIKKSYE